MSCHSLSAARESNRMLSISSGESLSLHECVPMREFSFLLTEHLQSKLRIFSISLSLSPSHVTVDIASDISHSSSSAARPRDYSLSSSSAKVSCSLGMFSSVSRFHRQCAHQNQKWNRRRKNQKYLASCKSTAIDLRSNSHDLALLQCIFPGPSSFNDEITCSFQKWQNLCWGAA